MAKRKQKQGQDEVLAPKTASGSDVGVDEAGGVAGAGPVVKGNLTTEAGGENYKIDLRRAVMDVAVSSIHGSEDNIRTSLGDLQELAASIKAVGVLQPLLVELREYDQDTITKLRKPGYRVVCGHRRLAAAKLAGIASVPVIVATFESNQQRMLVMLAENIHRENMNPMDEARAFDALRVMGYDAHHVAIRIHRSSEYVLRRIKLLQLHPTFQKMVGDGVLPLEQGFVLARLGHDVQEKVFNDAITKVLGPGYTGRLGNAGDSEWPDVDNDDVKTPWPWTLAELREVLDGFAVVDMEWAIWISPDTKYMNGSGTKCDDPVFFPGRVKLGKGGPMAPKCAGCQDRVMAGSDLFGGKEMDRCLRPECYRAKEMKAATFMLQMLVDAGREPVALIHGDAGYRVDDLRAALPMVQFEKLRDIEVTGLVVDVEDLTKAKHKNILIGMVWCNNPSENYADNLRPRVNCELVEYKVIEPKPKATPEKAEPKAVALVVERDEADVAEIELTTRQQADNYQRVAGLDIPWVKWLYNLSNNEYERLGLDGFTVSNMAATTMKNLEELKAVLVKLADGKFAKLAKGPKR
jgi:ParB/RepB/Spo0J family partition protein